MEQKKPHNRGGARPNAGRPKKDDTNWGKIHCVLRKDTILALRQGCGGKEKQYGAFLQDHLDKHPLPDRETYLFRQKMKQLQSEGLRDPRKLGNPAWDRYIRQLKRQERQRVWDLKHPKEAAYRKSLQKTFDQLAKEEQKKAKAAAKANGA